MSAVYGLTDLHGEYSMDMSDEELKFMVEDDKGR